MMDDQQHRMIYLSRCYRNLTAAGNKAKTDNETTMLEMGFVNVGLPQKVSGNNVVVFFYDLAGVLKACASMRRGDILVLQYPVKKYFSFLCDVAHLHGARVIALIHDLGSFRRRKLTVEKEVSRLSHADCVIASNKAMEQWLKDKGLKVTTASLGLFDYRSSSTPSLDKPSSTYKVAYAGSLNPRKNSFFLQFPKLLQGFELHVFGKGDAMPSLQGDKRIVFHDFTPADEFIARCGCDFGLVWDGDSLDACTGPWGGYLRYNSPHKASFYLRAGLPVIVWKEAAIAPIIESEEAGITISSLRELPSRLAGIKADNYAAMRKRVMALAEKLGKGWFFMNAVEKACAKL